MRRIEPDRIARAARIYASNQEASEALGIAPGSFSRLCRTYGIETPHARRSRRRQECRHRYLPPRPLYPQLTARDVEALGLDLSEVLAASPAREALG